MASAIDTGDISSPYTTVHTRNKQTPGARLAAAALATLLGRPDTPYLGPAYQGAEARLAVSGTGASSLVVTVSFESVSLYGAPLVLNTSVVCTAGVPPDLCATFDVQVRAGRGEWRGRGGAPRPVRSVQRPGAPLLLRCTLHLLPPRIFTDPATADVSRWHMAQCNLPRTFLRRLVPRDHGLPCSRVMRGICAGGCGELRQCNPRILRRVAGGRSVQQRGAARCALAAAVVRCMVAAQLNKLFRRYVT